MNLKYDLNKEITVTKRLSPNKFVNFDHISIILHIFGEGCLSKNTVFTIQNTVQLGLLCNHIRLLLYVWKEKARIQKLYIKKLSSLLLVPQNSNTVGIWFTLITFINQNWIISESKWKVHTFINQKVKIKWLHSYSWKERDIYVRQTDRFKVTS